MERVRLDRMDGDPVGSSDLLCVAENLRVKYLEITELHTPVYQMCWESISILYTHLPLLVSGWSFLTHFPSLKLNKSEDYSELDIFFFTLLG